MINWKVRFKQRWFWVTIIPAVIVFIQAVAMVFGWQLDLQDLQGRLVAVADAAFALISLVGVTTDFTTDGLGDSARALTYTQPAPNAAFYGLCEYVGQSEAADEKMVDWEGDDDAS